MDMKQITWAQTIDKINYMCTLDTLPLFETLITEVLPIVDSKAFDNLSKLKIEKWEDLYYVMYHTIYSVANYIENPPCIMDHVEKKAISMDTGQAKELLVNLMHCFTMMPEMTDKYNCSNSLSQAYDNAHKMAYRTDKPKVEKVVKKAIQEHFKI